MSWVDVLSICLNAILIIVSAGLAVAGWKDNQKKNDQVKIWMEQANGIQQSLNRIVQDKWANNYTEIKDVTSAVWAIQASSFALYQSLYDERVGEKDYLERQKAIRKDLEKQRKNSQKRTNQS